MKPDQLTRRCRMPHRAIARTFFSSLRRRARQEAIQDMHERWARERARLRRLWEKCRDG